MTPKFLEPGRWTQPELHRQRSRIGLLGLGSERSTSSATDSDQDRLGPARLVVKEVVGSPPGGVDQPAGRVGDTAASLRWGRPLYLAGGDAQSLAARSGTGASPLSFAYWVRRD